MQGIFYMIEVQFYDKELLKPNFFWYRLRSRFTSSKHSNVLKIPIYLLDVGLPERVFETMSYFEREWRIQQNRQRNQTSKAKEVKISLSERISEFYEGLRGFGRIFQGFFLFCFSRNYGIIGSKNFKRKKRYELKRLHCKY